MKLLLMSALHADSSICDVCGKAYYEPRRKSRRARWLLTDNDRVVRFFSVCVSCLREAVKTTTAA